ncbi:hypothetical protein P43SY_006050 [Pythium insidiosum]|uniref:Rab11 family GTPase n=1 Tax=Pythium insidiosum TaxID=114742 RepID=A0AAD5LZR0_PYTIN|nr:hypothetical protein P43SY_006050 [Pythium insidiosum]
MTGGAQKTPFQPLQQYVSAKDVAHARLGASNNDPSRRLGSASSYSDDRLGRSLAVASPSSFSAASPRCSTPGGDPEYTLKVVLIGDSGVGKSNLVLRFAKNRFNAKSQQTVGFEFATKSIRVGDRRLKAQLWDSSGQERFQSLTAAYYRNAVGAMVVYDITNRATFESATKWLAQIHEHCHESLVTILVGNKCDLAHLPNSRQVSTLEAARFAAKHGMEFVETSALDATNVVDAFKKIIVPVGRLLSPSANPNNVVRLPAGWRRVLSRTRPGEYSYENQYTKERIAFAPREAAKPSQYSFRDTGSISSPGNVTVTRESLQLQHQKAFLAQQQGPQCGATCTTCVIQ